MRGSPYVLQRQRLFWFGRGRASHCICAEHKLYHGLGMDALGKVCTWNTNVIMDRAWMHWSPYVRATRSFNWLGSECNTQTLFWFRHGCTGHCEHLERKHFSGHGPAWMLTAYTLNTNVTVLWSGHGCAGQRVLLKSTLLWLRHGCTNIGMVQARMHWSLHAVGTSRLLF